MRFRLRTLFAVTASVAAALFLGMSVYRNESDKHFVIDKVESLNGSVTDEFPLQGVFLSAAGLPILARDRDLEELAPYLARTGISKVALASTHIGDAGLRALIVKCAPQLEYLDIGDTEISDGSLQLLPSCTNLKTIVVSKELLTDAAIRALAATRSLHEIFVHTSQPDDAHVLKLKNAVGKAVKVETITLKSTVID
jgi:hypothetical protein